MAKTKKKEAKSAVDALLAEAEADAPMVPLPDADEGFASFHDVREEKALAKSKAALTKLENARQGFSRQAIQVMRSKHIDALLAEANKSSPGRMYTDKVIVVIPTPAPVFEYLIGQSGFPLESVLQLAGPTASMKSSLLFEFCRWFMEFSGFGMSYLVENEDKIDTNLLQAFTRQRVPVSSSDSVEMVQSETMRLISEAKALMTGTPDEPGPGPCIPCLFGIDSVVGKLSDETKAKVRKAGHGDRNHAIEALQLTQWMKDLPEQMRNFPLAVVLINQEKYGKDEMGKTQERVGGASQIGFQCGFDIRMRRVGHYQTAEGRVNTVQLRLEKNSFGIDQRSIRVRTVYVNDRSSGKTVLKAHWDWDWALINLLTWDKLDPDVRRSLKEQGVHIGVVSSSQVENKAWSRNLGMTEKGPVSWSELGAMFRQHPETYRKIRLALGVQIRPRLRGSYAEDLAKAGEEAP